MCLQPRVINPDIARLILQHRKGFISHRLRRFFHREHASGVTGLLIGRAVRADPLRDELPLAVVLGRVHESLLPSAFATRAQIGREPAIGLERDVTSRPLIAAHVEPQSTTALRDQEAVGGRGCRSLHRPLGPVVEEPLGDLRAQVNVDFPMFRLLRTAFQVVRALELVVSGGFPE